MNAESFCCQEETKSEVESKRQKPFLEAESKLRVFMNNDMMTASTNWEALKLRCIYHLPVNIFVFFSTFGRGFSFSLNAFDKSPFSLAVFLSQDRAPPNSLSSLIDSVTNSVS